MKYLFLALLISLSIIAIAQENSIPSNNISIRIIQYDRIEQSLNNVKKLRPLNALQYQRTINNKFFWQVGLSYSRSTINDNCNTCADHYHGVADLREFVIAPGAGIKFKIADQSVIKPLAEVNLFYAYSKYTGDFSGGFSGGGIIVKHTYRSLGVNPNIGLEINPIRHVGIRLRTGPFISNYSMEDAVRNETYNNYAAKLSSKADLVFYF